MPMPHPGLGDFPQRQSQPLLDPPAEVDIPTGWEIFVEEAQRLECPPPDRDITREQCLQPAPLGAGEGRHQRRELLA